VTATVPAELQARMLSAAPDIDLSFRRMFGGIMAYSGEVVFASLSDVGLALKFSGVEHAKMVAAGGVPLRYEPDAPASKSYVVLPAAVIADSAQLHDWIVASSNGLKPKAGR